VAYRAPAALSDNRIYNNGTGVVATLSDLGQAFGFVDQTAPNEIYGNALGVRLTGLMRNQYIHDNTVGVSGTGVLGGSDLSLANVIAANGTGVQDFTGTIQYNRIAGNGIGISATAGQKIFHNILYRNTQTAVLVSGVADVRIFNNTFYAVTGDNIRIQSAASNVQVQNNILWAESGYDLYVANDSRGSTATTTTSMPKAAAGWCTGPRTSPISSIGKPTWRGSTSTPRAGLSLPRPGSMRARPT
jgi:hypothetical protein